MATSSPQMHLKLLRTALAKQKLDGFLVPRQDEFQGEYVAAYAERLKWLTGFAGSWGAAIIMAKKAAIFVDGRYTSQVRDQVDVKAIMPQHLIDAPPTDWIKANFKKGQTLGFDPDLTTIADAKRYQAACESVGAKFVAVSRNPIDSVWDDQPVRPDTPLNVQPERFAGKSAKQKLAELAKALVAQGAEAVFLAEPSSVSWLFNIRGDDVPFTPVALTYALVPTKGKATIFIDEARVPKDVKAALKSHAEFANPSAMAKALKALADKKKSVLVDAGSAPQQVALLLKGAKLIEGQDPCTMPKAQKNAVEQAGARAAQLRDGAALSRFLHWVSVEGPKGHLNEAIAADMLAEFRKATGKLEDLSFESISASGPNAAIPHYHLDPAHARAIKTGEIYLIDSGGQYRDGTTDVTRTVMIGEPTLEMKDRFTRVLKGMIAISVARFPAGTTGAHIDALARASLWSAGLDFDHGTGHGVGSYLSVHEGPARISKVSHVALRPGMLLSNEPGYYKPGSFGIRIENLLFVRDAEDVPGGERKMMGFETVTLAPIDRTLIDMDLLTDDELRWLNAYHARVLAEVGMLLDGEALSWLKQACAGLSRD
jgi:Xaa-Pro aminopeptidase